MSSSTPTPVNYCGRIFTAEEIKRIIELIASDPPRNRAQLSRLVCDELRWLRADGRRKDMSCRVAMIRMDRDGIISLPRPRKGNGNGKIYGRKTPAADPDLPITADAQALGELQLQLIEDKGQSHLWNEYIQRYHYLGYSPLPGAQLRYFVRSQGKVLALLGFGASAWKVAPRDRFIGWTPEQRVRRLNLIVNNARFLILPWVRSHNLASKLLSMAARRLVSDWEKRYGYCPVLLETFVETQRFRGTCYKAANWIYLGETQGRGKLDVHKTASLPIKAVLVLPLQKNFRQVLCS